MEFSRSYSNKVFVSVLALFLLFAACFMLFQGSREKTYRVNLLDAKLSVTNDMLMSQISATASVSDTTFNLKNSSFNGRVTIIDAKGKVIYDSSTSDTNAIGNHLNRKEIQDALKSGHGTDICRESETMGCQYFYSATWYADRQLFIRTSLPYDPQLIEMLRDDQHYLYFAIAVFMVLSLLLYFFNRRLGIYRKLREMQTKMLHEREELVNMKHQLTQNVAHELRTPVSSIHGYMQTLVNNPNIDADKAKHFIERTYAQSTRLTNMLRDISLLTKMDNAHEAPEKTRFNLREAIDDAIADMQDEINSHNMTIDVYTPRDIQIDGNYSLLYSIFRNLIENSVAYAGDGSNMKIMLYNSDDNIYHFSFSDNGVGVSNEHLSRLFDRFYRVDKGRSRKQGGTGLGLSIVKNAIMLHGGTISATNNGKKGLKFSFDIKRN